jgi:predicted RNase H-like nuclease (RuvC/YqgF family)
LEAQTDATDREKQIRQEEIKELEEQLQDALSTIQQQQQTLGQLQQHISASHIFDTSDEMNLAKQVWRHCYTQCALLNLLFP